MLPTVPLCHLPQDALAQGSDQLGTPCPKYPRGGRHLGSASKQDGGLCPRLSATAGSGGAVPMPSPNGVLGPMCINTARRSLSDSTPQNTFWTRFPRESLMGFVVPKPQAMPHFHPLMQAIYQETLRERGGFLTGGSWEQSADTPPPTAPTPFSCIPGNVNREESIRSPPRTQECVRGRRQRLAGSLLCLKCPSVSVPTATRVPRASHAHSIDRGQQARRGGLDSGCAQRVSALLVYAGDVGHHAIPWHCCPCPQATGTECQVGDGAAPLHCPQQCKAGWGTSKLGRFLLAPLVSTRG